MSKNKKSHKKDIVVNLVVPCVIQASSSSAEDPDIHSEDIVSEAVIETLKKALESFPEIERSHPFYDFFEVIPQIDDMKILDKHHILKAHRKKYE